MKNKYIMILTIFSNLLIFFSCSDSSGGRSDPTPQEEEEKSIFSKWTHTDESRTLDATGGSFNIPIDVAYENSDGVCICRHIFSGDESSGTFINLSCIPGPGGSGSPGCNGPVDPIERYNYTKEDGIFKFCDALIPGDDCETFF